MDFSVIIKKRCPHLSALGFGSTVKIVQREFCSRRMYIMSSSLPGSQRLVFKLRRIEGWDGNPQSFPELDTVDFLFKMNKCSHISTYQSACTPAE